MKFNDKDNSGSLTAGDELLGNWQIHITGPSFDQTVVTDPNPGPNFGHYHVVVPAGPTYLVCEVLQNGWTQTAPTAGPGCGQGEGPIGYSVTVTGGVCCSGITITGKDFGNRITFTPPTKTGMKWDDLDGDGVKDANEPGIPNWPINLYGPGPGFPAAGTFPTDANGNYTIQIPSAGTWRVCEGPGPAGYTQTYPNGGTPTPNLQGEDIVSTCPAPPTGGGIYGYEFTVPESGGPNLTDNNFGNHKEVVCQKPTMYAGMDNAFPGHGDPDVTIQTETTTPSIQDAVDNATDTNGDGYIIVLLIAHADGSLGGTIPQNVVVSKDYGAKPFGLFGCSVTLTGGGSGAALSITKDARSGPAAPNEYLVNGRKTTIFTMDVHGGNSKIGVQADGQYRYIRNTYGTNNATGILVTGNNNTVHNGKGEANSGNGVCVIGDNNLVTDTDSFSNKGDGFNIKGSGNQLLKLNPGDKGKGNTGDGVEVNGNTNTLSEIKAYANGGWGILVNGNSNSLSKNVAGDKGKGNGKGIKVAGVGNRLTENKASANTGNGFEISGGTNNNANNANWLKSNVSNSGNSGVVDTENGGAEYSLLGYVKNDGGGNKADNIVVPKTTAPTKCTAFPATNAVVNFAAVSTCE